MWPGQPMTAHWGVPDPAAAEGTDAERHLAFAEAYRQLSNRISAFLSLPLSSIDRMSLQTRLREIGAARPPSSSTGRSSPSPWLCSPGCSSDGCSGPTFRPITSTPISPD